MRTNVEWVQHKSVTLTMTADEADLLLAKLRQRPQESSAFVLRLIPRIEARIKEARG